MAEIERGIKIKQPEKRREVLPRMAESQGLEDMK